MTMNILVVDDSALMRSMIARILMLTGLDVSAVSFAGNGEQALSVMSEQWIDLVLADINMPVMDGLAMVRAMRADVALRNIPVIVVSTEGSQSKLEQINTLGVAAVVHKPFAPEDLVRAVNGVLHESVR